MGRHEGVAADQGDLVRLGRIARAEPKLFEHVRASKVAKDEVSANVGNAADAMAKDGAKKISATYEFAIHTHGSIGPSCAIAEFKDGKLTSWSASQATHNLRKQLAKMFDLPPENVRCIYVEGSGCYGRNGHEDAAADAALLAKAVGLPVRVQWSRADEHGWDPKGPPTLVDLRATLDASGAVTAWDSEFFIPQQTPNAFVVPLVAATLSGKPSDETIAPGNIFQNSNIPYKFANIKAVCHRLETTPFRPSWIRTPGRMQNTFANESFMDELAAAADADPIAFRLKYLDPADTRGVEILNRVAALAQWEKRPSPRGGQSGDVVTGRGVSYCKYELVRTYIAVVAEVEVKRSTGEIRARKFFVLHDCGQIINPDGVQSQIEGNIIQTVSSDLEGGTDVQPLGRDQPRLGQLPDPDLPRSAGHPHRPDRPAGRKALGRRRAVGGGGAVGDLERGVRCDRRAASFGAVHAGEGQGGVAARRLSLCRVSIPSTQVARGALLALVQRVRRTLIGEA